MATSSNKLNIRRRTPQLYFGSQSDHYIRANGHCHPDYTAVPIGRVDGPRVCIRRRPQTNVRQTRSEEYESRDDREILPQSSREAAILPPMYRKYSPTMYDLKANAYTYETRAPSSNPYPSNQMHSPNEKYNIRKDYYRIPIAYDGTGIRKLRTPAGTGDEGMVYPEYAYDRQTVPPPRFDITRLHQPYPLWLKSQQAMGRKGQATTETIDTSY